MASCDVLGAIVVYKIQILHPASGFYLGTGHESADLDALKRLVDSEAFSGPGFRVVDEAGMVVYGPVARPREGEMSVDELAAVMGAPVSTEADLEQLLGLPAGALAEAPTAGGVRHDVGYSLQAVHCEPLESIVMLNLTTEEGEAIIEKVWPDVDFWCAPGGSSMPVQSAAEAEAINAVLKSRFLEFHPVRHRWMFHVYLIGDDE